jgi:hypothetical protein
MLISQAVNLHSIARCELQIAESEIRNSQSEFRDGKLDQGIFYESRVRSD